MSVIQKIKDSAAFKTVVSSVAMAPVVAGSMITAFAADESSAADFSGTLQNSFNSMQSDIFHYIGIVLPIALGIVAAFLGIKKAIGFFKSTTK